MTSSWYILSFVIIASLISLGQGFFFYSSKKSHGYDRSGPANPPPQWQNQQVPQAHQYSNRGESMPWASYQLPQGGHIPYVFDAATGPVTVALPVALPVSAQMSSAPLSMPAHSPGPATTLRNIQLVPCLCPVTTTGEFEQSPSPTPSASPTSSASFMVPNSPPP